MSNLPPMKVADPAAFGRVMGLLGPFTTVAAIGPWVAGHLRDGSGTYDDAWMLFIGIMVPAALAMVFMTPRPQPQPVVPAGAERGS